MAITFLLFPYNGFMKKNKLLLSAVSALLLFGNTVSAEETGDNGLYFDFNNDGITDSSDWSEVNDWIRDYKIMDGTQSFYGNQEAPATLNLLIREMTDPMPGKSDANELSEAEEFYLINGYSSSIKSQNPFTTCWAFSTMASLESNALLKSKGIPALADASLTFHKEDDTYDYSELFLALENMHPVRDGVQKGEGNTSDPDTENAPLIHGGFFSTSEIVLSSWNGAVTEQDEPYEPLIADEEGAGLYGYHNEEKDFSEPAAFHLQNMYYLDSPAVYHADLEKKAYIFDSIDEDAIQRIKDAMVKNGALVFTYDADISLPGETGNGAFFNYQNWCQYSNASVIGMNHAITAVGWNDHYPKENFANNSGELPPADGAWLIKNSWGDYRLMKELIGDRIDETLADAKGTEDEISMNISVNYGLPDEEGHGTGYFWLSYYDHTLLSAAALDAETRNAGYSYDHIYQYDYYHGPEFIPLAFPVKDTGAKTANLFESKGNETLTAVSVYVPANQSDVTLEVYLPEANETVPGGSPVSKMKTTLDTGLHTLNLDDRIELQPGQKFMIVSSVVSHAKESNEAYSWMTLETGIREDLQTHDNVNSQKLHMVCNEGESLYSLDGGRTWNSPSILNGQDEGKVFEFGNARIKAYTTDTPQEGTPVITSQAPSAAPTVQTPAADTAPAGLTSSSAAAPLVLVLAGVSAFLIWFFLCRD